MSRFCNSPEHWEDQQSVSYLGTLASGENKGPVLCRQKPGQDAVVGTTGSIALEEHAVALLGQDRDSVLGGNPAMTWGHGTWQGDAAD
jgi:hypothetical protein